MLDKIQKHEETDELKMMAAYRVLLELLTLVSNEPPPSFAQFKEIYNEELAESETKH